MIPDFPQIIACPLCKGVAKYESLISGNTFGSTLYTDGKMISPMLPLPPPVVRCTHCRGNYWLSDAEKLGRLDFAEGTPPEWIDAEYVEEPPESEYYESIALGLAKTADEEKTLRILAWWRGNDLFREQENGGGDDSSHDRRRENLEVLLGMFDEYSQNELLMKSEVLRELGRFDSAEELLSRVVSVELENLIDQLKELCRQRVTVVRELKR